jgi:hypothetical protein
VNEFHSQPSLVQTSWKSGPGGSVTVKGSPVRG